MNKVIVICGPTASGKTKISIELAKQFNGEIINADSMQIYQEINIGTAKIKDEEKDGITHYLFDIKKLDDDYSVQEYQAQARTLIDEISARGKLPILVGGTGLYINAVLYNYEFNEKKHDTYDDLSNEEILTLIKQKGIAYHEHVNNRRRLLNALNNGKKIDSDKLLYDATVIGLTMPRETLYDRINYRVALMKDLGLEEEAIRLITKYPNSRALKTAIGYKEFMEEDVDVFEKIAQHTRNYAKRQYTWFNNKLPVVWFDITEQNYEQKIIEYIKNRV